MKIPFEWETIDASKAPATYAKTERAEVIGGWLIRGYLGNLHSSIDSLSLQFIPDPLHEWELIWPKKHLNFLLKNAKREDFDNDL